MKKFIKNFDQKYLGNAIKSLFRGNKKSAAQVVLSPEEREAARRELMIQIARPLPTDRGLKRVEIIVLKYKDPEVEVQCAKYLVENTEWPYKINFFDNRLSGKNASKIWNKLVKESTCDYIVIMDSDVFVPKLDPDWLTRLMSTFEKYPDCYVVSPKVTRTSGVQQKADQAEDKPPEKLTTIFAGMCVLYKKEIFEKVGWFDEDFLLYGSDGEWVNRLLKSPYTAYVRPDVLVEHYGHYSTKKAAKTETDYAKIADLEKEYAETLFKKKTGRE